MFSWHCGYPHRRADPSAIQPGNLSESVEKGFRVGRVPPAFIKATGHTVTMAEMRQASLDDDLKRISLALHDHPETAYEEVCFGALLIGHRGRSHAFLNAQVGLRA